MYLMNKITIKNIKKFDIVMYEETSNRFWEENSKLLNKNNINLDIKEIKSIDLHSDHLLNELVMHFKDSKGERMKYNRTLFYEEFEEIRDNIFSNITNFDFLNDSSFYLSSAKDNIAIFESCDDSIDSSGIGCYTNYGYIDMVINEFECHI